MLSCITLLLNIAGTAAENSTEKNLCSDQTWLNEACSRSPGLCAGNKGHICSDHPACPANKPPAGNAACPGNAQGGQLGCIQDPGFEAEWYALPPSPTIPAPLHQYPGLCSPPGGLACLVP